MEMSFRWYGNEDPVTLENIPQNPQMKEIVSIIYDIPAGLRLIRPRPRSNIFKRRSGHIIKIVKEEIYYEEA